ncbi:hypothetical protein RB597_007667 [Gaeumannomyces tritici]
MPVTDDVRTVAGVFYQAFVTFPYHAYMTPRSGSNLSSKPRDTNMHTASAEPGHLARGGGAPSRPNNHAKDTDEASAKDRVPSPPLRDETFSDQVLAMCTSAETVSSLLAQEPDLAPKEAWKRLCVSEGAARGQPSTSTVPEGSGGTLPADSLDRAAMCGRWGSQRPSDLFLKMYHDALVSIDGHPERGMVSPSLMGSSGVLPLTIISTIPDIVRHMANLIVAANREVFLATNFWQNSVASKVITDALKELSRRVGERGSGEKVVVKIMYDRGSIRQLVDPHAVVSEKDYAGGAVGLPAAAEVPNLELEVMNYHSPILGTFHSKFMIVDRRAAVLQSNNIQDNDNLEMLVHLEGPVVDAVYDMALLSWSKALSPPLPTRDSPAASEDAPCFRAGPETMSEPAAPPTPPSGEADAGGPVYDATIDAEARRVQALLTPSPSNPSKTHLDAVTRHLNHTTNPDFRPEPRQAAASTTAVAAPEDDMTPLLAHAPHDPFPMALVCRPPHGPPDNSSDSNPQNAAWLAALRYATESVFIQSPTLNAEPLLPAIVEACERGVDVTCFICLGYNDIGELLPKQGGHNEMIARRLHTALSPTGRERLHYHWYVGRDCAAPLTQSRRLRSCHIKLLVADGRVAVVGSGNQDTQSWMHSQEVNALLDLPPHVARDWAEGLRRNQNTHLYGALDPVDGVWRDKDGNEADEATGVDPGRFSWGKGIVAALKRVKGTGGF